MKVQGKFSFKELNGRPEHFALNVAQALVSGNNSLEWKTRRRAAGWLVGFCFTFRGGPWGALASSFKFHSNLYMVIEPHVLKRTSKKRTHIPKARGFWFPVDTLDKRNPILLELNLSKKSERSMG